MTSHVSVQGIDRLLIGTLVVPEGSSEEITGLINQPKQFARGHLGLAVASADLIPLPSALFDEPGEEPSDHRTRERCNHWDPEFHAESVAQGLTGERQSRRLGWSV